jgi:hypothetical protein
MLPPSLLALRIIFFAVIALAASASASSEVDRCWMDAWYSPPLETIWKLHWGLPSDEPEWEFKDPAFLYLTFDEIGSMTFLHPTKNRSGAQETSFMLGHEQSAQAFGYQIVRASSQGYEVSFQQIDPITGQPLPLRENVVFFSRSRRTHITLSDKLTVFGCYGDPHLRNPWWSPPLRRPGR